MTAPNTTQPCEQAEWPCCDNGKVWNNADPTSGQWVPCERHGGEQ